ncbi:hypothetical protein OG558_32495 [Kribbella sp. NBC_01510]|uniref:hypothetical protein n=1 Tax=Kribbella sp. NBC_01510 TaxID=2903581 RepID=UPI003868F0DC
MPVDQEQIDQAKLEQTLAEAAKAKADAEKAKSDAQKAAVDAAKAQREEAEASGALGREQREAAAHKAIAEAQKSDFDTQQARVAALIPDLSKATVPELKVSGDQSLFSSRVTHKALGNAAKALADAVAASLPAKGAGRVLLTSADDLASLDGVYVEVEQGLKMLHDAADALLPNPDGIAPAIVAGVVAAIPGLISFFAPTRSVSSHAMSLDDPVILADVAGRLVGARDIMLADFRTVPQDGVVKLDRELMDKRGLLLDEKAGADSDQAEAEAEAAVKQSALDTVLSKHQQDPEEPAAQEEIDNATKARDHAAALLVQKTRNAEQVLDVIKGIDDFRTAIHVVPSGSARSPLVTAALHEGLHGTAGAADRFAAVLFVKGAGGSIDQLTDDRKVRKDRFDLLGTATIAYWVIDPLDSLVKASGTAVGSARIQGTIGDTLTVTND